ncbi:outer membrane beta-barrel protein HofA [Helicobacter pylori]
MLNQKIWLGLLALNGVFLNAFEYQISARVGSFSRIAFNQSVINSKKGIYPTGSYVTTTGALQVDSSLLPKGIEKHKLGFGVGGEIGSLAYDSTKFLIDEADPKAGFQPANWYYMGRWEGYLMQHSQNWTREQKAQNARPYVLYNLYLDYQYKDIFGIKLGRYPSKALFFSGFNQGFELFYRWKKFRIEWFSTFGRALANEQSIRDFYASVNYKQKINYGMYNLNLIYENKYIRVVPFIWFYPKNFNAPGFEITHDTKSYWESDWRIQTTFYAWFPFYSDYLSKDYYRAALVGKKSASLFVFQRVHFRSYRFGWSVYKNFGNGSAQLGWNGSPADPFYDTKDDTPYEDAYSNFYNANSITINAFIGKSIKNRMGN